MKGRYGDSNLIKYGDYEILIDGGTSTDAPAVQSALSRYVEDGVLDMLVVSHPDADHIDGLEKQSTFASIDSIGMIVENGDTRGNGDFESLMDRLYPESIPTIVTELVDKPIQVDEDFSITFLNQSNYTSSSASKNNRSIGMLIEYKNTKAFFGGDMESSACNSIMANYPNLTSEDDYVIFKILHHGSNGTNSNTFLNYLKPDFAFVTTGMRLNSSNLPNYSTHPYLEVMKRVGVKTKDTYWSGINGELTIKCDGYSASATGQGRTTDYQYKHDDQILTANRDEEKDVTFFESKYYLMAIEYNNAPNYAGVTID